MRRAIVIGAGFSGLAAAAHLAKRGFSVDLIEKNDQAGGRARVFEKDGFVFDMGPSWYWMPDVFEHFFNQFGKRVSDYYTLKRLDPSYQVIFEDEIISLPASRADLYTLFEKLEPGSSAKLETFLQEAAYKYKVGIQELVYKPGLSILEFADMRVAKGLFQMHLLKDMASYIRKSFTNPKIIQLLEFPVLFLGATADKTPALYSLMNYADMALGTWYPDKGMHEIINAMVQVAEEQGVRIHLNTEVTDFVHQGKKIESVLTNNGTFQADLVVSGADYHHIEQVVLGEKYRNYSEKYWQKRKMAPSCLIYYIGLNTKLPDLEHHNLFFDADFGQHASDIYTQPKWPEKPLFYACVPSKTDATVAPEDGENLFLLIPVAPGVEETSELQEHYFQQLADRLQVQTGIDIRNHVVYRRDYAYSDFRKDYYAFKGNAYGLANTLDQTAVLKPRLKSRKVENLYFTGQLTTPGPGVPPSLISGEVVAEQIAKDFKIHAYESTV